MGFKGTFHKTKKKTTTKNKPDKTNIWRMSWLVRSNKIGLPQRELDKANKTRMNENNKTNKTNKR